MLPDNNDYKDLVEDIKSKVREAQYRAMVKANGEMIQLYWSGVSEYKLTQEIPEAFKRALPDAEVWEKHIRLPFDEENNADD